MKEEVKLAAECPPSQPVPGTERRPYTRPELTRLGAVETITHGPGSGLPDLGGTQPA